MLASLCRNHVVVVGVGKVGYQVDQGAARAAGDGRGDREGQRGDRCSSELFDKGIPVIQGNARMTSILEQAGVRKAKAVIVTTSDDLTNLDIGAHGARPERRRHGS